MTSHPEAPHPDPTESGAGIAEALAALDGLDEIPVPEHVGRFHTLHESLITALAIIDEV